MKKHWPLILVLAAVAVFLVYKLSGITYRFGDGNAYLYMAKMLVSGALPYKAFFLADPPFLVLFLSPFYLLFKDNLLLFQTLPILLEAATAFFLYLLAKKRDESFAFLAPILYLFSFTVLATSDYLTGIQLTVFFVTLGLVFAEHDKLSLSGASFALAILTKLYALPAFAGLLAYRIFKEKKKALKILLGASVAGLVIMLPFLIASFGDVWKYMVVHQLHRPPGLNKWHVWSFFLGKEWFLLFFGIIGLSFRRNRDLVAPFILTALFFLLFQDLYYLYLETLVPFLIIGTLATLSAIRKNEEAKAVLIPITVLYVVSFVSSIVVYKSDFYTIGRFLNAREVAAQVENLPAGPLYGSHEVAPLIALMSNRKLSGDYIDTNTQAFASGGESLQQASKIAVVNGAYLIGRVTDLPQYGIKDFGMDGYFSKDYFKFCKEALKLPSTSGEQDNFIGVYKCSANPL